MNCLHIAQKVGLMLITGAIAILIVLGLFLSMLSSSPKTEREFHRDTEV